MLNSSLDYWIRLNYILAGTRLEIFSVDALEAACELYGIDMRERFQKGGGGWPQEVTDIYASLKVIRALKKRRNLDIQDKKLRHAAAHIPGVSAQEIRLY